MSSRKKPRVVYATEDITFGGTVGVKAGTRGVVQLGNPDNGACNVLWDGRPNIVLCISAMYITQERHDALVGAFNHEQAAITEWVSKINALAREIDKVAESIHPAAWPSQLSHLHAKYKKLAAAGPAPVKPADRPTNKKQPVNRVSQLTLFEVNDGN